MNYFINVFKRVN